MKITTLLENTTEDDALVPKHGISLFIETSSKKVLFDAGPDQTFLDNAQKLGIDLSQVDIAFISHGHYDHGGGLPDFLKVNSKATVYLKDTAMTPHYARIFRVMKKDIGLPVDRIDPARCRFIKENFPVEDGMQIITNFETSGFIPEGNKSLCKTDESGRLVLDDFEHEICLVLEDGGKTIVVTGCAHSGIGNMLNSVKKDTGIGQFDLVIGGFHLFNPVLRKTESPHRMDTLLGEIAVFEKTVFYTGHCTGEQAFKYMSAQMPRRVNPFRTGSVIEI